MILEWKDSGFSPTDQLIGLIFDAGFVRRKDAKTLLNTSEASMLYRLRKANNGRVNPLIRSFPLTGGEHMGVALALTWHGVEYAHALVGINGRIVAQEGQMDHQLNLLDVLLRFIPKIAVDHQETIKWYSTREATDALHNMQQKVSKSRTEIKAPTIRPDALLGVNSKYAWVEYDNDTESASQLRKKMWLYTTHFEYDTERTAHVPVRTVVWVARNARRTEQLAKIWGEFEKAGTTFGTRMFFYERAQEDFKAVKFDKVDYVP